MAYRGHLHLMRAGEGHCAHCGYSFKSQGRTGRVPTCDRCWFIYEYMRADLPERWQVGMLVAVPYHVGTRLGIIQEVLPNGVATARGLGQPHVRGLSFTVPPANVEGVYSWLPANAMGEQPTHDDVAAFVAERRPEQDEERAVVAVCALLTDAEAIIARHPSMQPTAEPLRSLRQLYENIAGPGWEEEWING